MNRDTFARFPQTRWTMIRRAIDLSEDERNELLGSLVQRYWRPIYAFYRAKGMSTVDAEDAVQSFLLRFTRDGRLLDVAPERGRFRDWLIACAKHHMLDLHRQRHAKKRAPDKPVVSLQYLRQKEGAQFEPAKDEPPDAVFVDIWRRDVLDGALRRVKQSCVDGGRKMDYDIFCAYYLNDGEDRVTWQQLSEEFELPTWRHAARKADFVKVQLGNAIRQEVRQYANDEDEVDDEIRLMISS